MFIFVTDSFYCSARWHIYSASSSSSSLDIIHLTDIRTSPISISSHPMLYLELERTFI